MKRIILNNSTIFIIVFYAYIIITIAMVRLLGTFGIPVCMTDGKITECYFWLMIHITYF
jgi:hypothetical protein